MNTQSDCSLHDTVGDWGEDVQDLDATIHHGCWSVCRIAASNNCAVAVSTGGIQVNTLEGLSAYAEAGEPVPAKAADNAPVATGAVGKAAEGNDDEMHDRSDAVMCRRPEAEVWLLLSS